MPLHAAALAYLDEVARSGSIRQAARRLNIAASAVNRQILKLEVEFGTLLFERLPSGLRLTPAGELVVRHARATLHEYGRMRAELDALDGIRSGLVRIATLDEQTRDLDRHLRAVVHGQDVADEEGSNPWG